MKITLDLSDCWVGDESLGAAFEREMIEAIRVEVSKVARSIVKDPEVLQHLAALKKKLVAKAIEEVER